MSSTGSDAEPPGSPGGGARKAASADDATRDVREVVGTGVGLSLRVPTGAREEPQSELPWVDVSGLAGASVTLRRGFTTEDGMSLRVACVRGPSDRWAPGIEDLVLGRATAIARGTVPGAIERWDTEPLRTEGLLFDQRLSGLGRRDGAVFVAQGRHLLGFAGEARDAVLCTLVCAEHAASPEAPASRCGELVAAAAPYGAFLSAPPPSAPVRLVLLTGEHPEAAGVVFLAVFAVIVTALLALRPRPRP